MVVGPTDLPFSNVGIRLRNVLRLGPLPGLGAGEGSGDDLGLVDGGGGGGETRVRVGGFHLTKTLASNFVCSEFSVKILWRNSNSYLSKDKANSHGTDFVAEIHLT